MKECPKDFLQYEDEESFCFNCGTPLVAVENSQQTAVVQIAGSQEISCRSCGTSNKSNVKYCKKCGISLRFVEEKIHIPLNNPIENQETVVVSVPYNLQSEKFSSAPFSGQDIGGQNNQATKYIFGGLGALVLLIFIGIFLYPNNKSQESNRTSSIPKNSSDSGSNFSHDESDSSSSNTNTLPKSFNHEYKGTCNWKPCSMSLTREDDELNGTASTDRHSDTLSGTIESDGQFRLKGYENGVRFTGIYEGKISNDGSIEGSWSNPQSTKSAPFSLSRE